MKLIIDCGSTKADWVIIENSEILKSFNTDGFNPNYSERNSIINIIRNTPLNKENVISIKDIFFYGSGCGSIDNCNIIKELFMNIFTNANIEVTHDMMAACHAILGNKKGIACILGTGSNSCYFNGERITSQAISLGYILGDEGSGSHIGKNLLRDYFYKRMPYDLSLKFKNEYDIKIDTLITNTYHSSQVSKYLASFAKFALENINNEYINNLCSRCFDEFIENFIDIYDNSIDNKIGFVGSIAFYFQEIIKQRLENKGYILGKIIKKPIDGLIEYHSI